jgi:hypothetical protein
MAMGNLPNSASAPMCPHSYTRLVVIALLLSTQGVAAQPAERTPRRAHTVTLQMRPAVDEVFHLVIEQTMEVSSVRRDPLPLPTVGGRPIPAVDDAEVGPRRNRAPRRITVTTVHGHSTVESTDPAGTILFATLDSLRVQTGEAGRPLLAQDVPLGTGVTSRLRVAPNGAMSMLDGGTGASAVAPSLAAMPPMLPDRAVQVGDRWEHEVAIPSLPLTAYRTDGVLHAIFRLDSIDRRTGDAWVSVSGQLRRDGPTRDLPAGTRVITAGTVQGTLHFDRARGWITEATTAMFLRSDIVPPGEGSRPTHVGIRLTQRMRVH